ncbi:MAG TPA: phage tail assembly protein [Gaiellaceae bacterium]
MSDTEATPAAPQWPRVVNLKHPVQFGDELIASLEFQRGKLGIIKGLKLSVEVPVNDLVLIASRLSGQPPALIERLDIEDGQEVMSIALDFYGKCLAGTPR